MKKWQDATIFSFFPSAAAARMAVANVRMNYCLRNLSTASIENKLPAKICRLNYRQRNSFKWSNKKFVRLRTLLLRYPVLIQEFALLPSAHDRVLDVWRGLAG